MFPLQVTGVEALSMGRIAADADPSMFPPRFDSDVFALLVFVGHSEAIVSRAYSYVKRPIVGMVRGAKGVFGRKKRDAEAIAGLR